MDKEMRALNKLIKKCELHNFGSCSNCINKDICCNSLGDMSPADLIKKLEALAENYKMIK